MNKARGGKIRGESNNQSLLKKIQSFGLCTSDKWFFTWARCDAASSAGLYCQDLWRRSTATYLVPPRASFFLLYPFHSHNIHTQGNSTKRSINESNLQRATYEEKRLIYENITLHKILKSWFVSYLLYKYQDLGFLVNQLSKVVYRYVILIFIQNTLYIVTIGYKAKFIVEFVFNKIKTKRFDDFAMTC